MLSRTTITLYLSAILLSACASVQHPANGVATGIDAAPCIGSIPAVMPGLSENTNTALLKKVQHVSGQGGVCAAKSFVVVTPVRVYRVYDAQKPWSAYGNWWATVRPGGSREEYRAENAICKAWSRLDRLVACQVKAGSELAVGTTQSVTCEDGTAYPPTAALQVYLPNDPQKDLPDVENCREEGLWPPRQDALSSAMQ